MKYLLDVSTLIALVHNSHAFHQLATQWSQGKKLAICPITELGFLRVSTGFLKSPMPDARRALRSLVAKQRPDFIPCDIRALSGSVAPNSTSTTDWYLANLAHAHGMKWATLDQHARHPAVELIK